ncbi:MAG: hypothetical protein JRE63_10930 [Deltaproteobacteria bacterium]|jgi:hypothetical protein|nr:hypothetical protein [Deltaproteobacteria bacterium]
MNIIGKKVSWGIFVLILIGGCALQRTSQPLPQEQRDSLGQLAVTAVHFAPHLEIDITHGRGHGAAKGAGGGALASLEAGLRSGDAIGLLLGIVLAPVVATGGAVYGAVAADSAKVVDGHTKTFENYLLGTELQRLLKQDVIDQINLWTSHKVVRSDLIGSSNFDQVKDYHSESDIDSVLEVGINEISLSDQSVSNTRVVLRVTGITRLIKVENSSVVFDQEYQYQSVSRDLDDWAAKDGALLKLEFQTAIHSFAERIVNNYLLTPARFPSKLFSLEATRPEPQHCFFCEDQIEPLDTCQPELCWRPFPAPDELVSPDGEWLQHAEDIVYDLKIRKFSDLYIIDINDIEQSCFYPEAPLEPCQLYVWSVRARFWVDSTEYVTPWQSNYRNHFKTACSDKTMKVQINETQSDGEVK